MTTWKRTLSSGKFFYTSLILLSFAYILYEFIWIPSWILAADEFVFARHIYDYTQALPYRDFPAYKSVLGYYLYSIPFLFSQDILAPLFYIKDEIALLNAIFIAVTGCLALRFFDKKAILLGLLAIIANQFFLVYASELRVDMLSGWFGLFAAIAMLHRRIRLAGILTGIGFLISQKALWYLLAINGAILITIPIIRSLMSGKSLLEFNSYFLLPIAIYAIFWSLIASPSIVFTQLIYEAYIQFKIDFYIPVYFFGWYEILKHGPIIYLLWPCTFVTLLNNNMPVNKWYQRLFILSFGTITLFLLINYKQAFPYNFVFSIPAFFLLYSEWFTWLFSESALPIIDTHKWLTSRLFQFLVAAYTIAILFIVNYYWLPYIHNISAAIPLLLVYLLINQSGNKKMIAASVITGIFIISGIIYPIYQSVYYNRSIKSDYQQATIQVASKLLEPEGHYVGGVPFLYGKSQSVEGMKNLIAPAIAYLYQPSEKLRPLLLPSLYLNAFKAEDVLANLERSDTKVVINNSRIVQLPPAVRAYLANNFQHYYAGIYLYSPTINKKQLSFLLKFSAQYRIEAPKNAAIKIDGKKVRAGKIITLKRGDHISSANKSYRLALVPNIDKQLLPEKFQNDSIFAMLKQI